jgi:hypothetical protein
MVGSTRGNRKTSRADYRHEPIPFFRIDVSILPRFIGTTEKTAALLINTSMRPKRSSAARPYFWCGLVRNIGVNRKCVPIFCSRLQREFFRCGNHAHVAISDRPARLR